MVDSCLSRNGRKAISNAASHSRQWNECGDGRKQGKFLGKNFLIRLGFHAEQSSEENAKPKTPLDKYTH